MPVIVAQTVSSSQQCSICVCAGMPGGFSFSSGGGAPGGSYQFSGDQAHKIFEELFGGGFGASGGRSRPFGGGGGGGFSGFGGGGFPSSMDTDGDSPFFNFGGGMYVYLPRPIPYFSHDHQDLSRFLQLLLRRSHICLDRR